jgi:VCBS repeat-containing protein
MLAFPGNFLGSAELTLLITGDTAATGTVEIPGLGPPFLASFTVTPGALTAVSIPAAAALSDSDATGRKGIRVSATAEIVVYGLSHESASTDGFLGLPVDFIGTDYIVLARNQSVSPSQFAVVAVEDATTVTITPRVDTGTRTAGTPYTIVLNRFDTYQLRSDTNGEDLSGSVVTADKRIAVFGGNQCAQVPEGTDFCDYVVEQLTPTSAWGTRFLTVALAKRTGGDRLRIMAQADGTTVSIDGVLTVTLARGQFHEADLASGTTHVIEASKPVLVMQYAKGSQADDPATAEFGDPFMMTIVPSDQFMSTYTVPTTVALLGPAPTEYFVNVVVPSSSIESCTVDGVAFAGRLVTGTGFADIGSSGFKGGQLQVDDGVHTLTCPSPFGAYVYAFGGNDSYGYPAGLALANRPPTAVNDSYAVDEDSALTIGKPGVLGNDTDPDGDVLTARQVSGPTNGSLTLNADGAFIYTPRANFNGTDSFTYVARDPSGAESSAATVTITVNNVNDAPIAQPNSFITAEGTPVLVTLSGTDIDSPRLVFSVVTGPSHGVLSVVGSPSCSTLSNSTATPGSSCSAGVIYTPAPNYFGTDTFTFKVNDGSLDSNVATVSLTVTAVNDPPVLIVPGPMTVNEGTPVSFMVSATDVDGPFPLIFSVGNLPAGATLTLQSSTSALFSWTPSSAQGGPNPYLLQFTVSDGQLSNTKTVSITVNDTIADRDGDGVPDAVDNCPDDPNANQVDVCHNSPQTTSGAQTITRVDGQIPVTFTATVTSDKTDISFLPPTLFTVNCKVINIATGAVVPREQTPESGPFVLNLGAASRPGDLVKILARTTASFSTTFDLRSYHPTLPDGSYTTLCTYVQFGQILNLDADDPPIWTGEIQAPPQTIFIGRYQFAGFSSPLPGAKFSRTNTVPVKFTLTDGAGAFVTNCTCTLTFQRLDSAGNPFGPAVPVTPTSGTGNQFKYDAKNNQYVFTVASGSLPVGPVQLQANLHDGSTPRTVNVVVNP